MTAARPGLLPDPGSFRDPTNRVMVQDERVFRVLDGVAREEFEALERTRFYGDARDSGRIIATRMLEDVPVGVDLTRWSAVLEHEKVPVLSYPYEWSFGMLRDAALLQLDLTLEALDEGFITKDATPYNVQFLGTQPVHIDLGSFERVSAGDPWFGYRQFCEQFLFPLVLSDRLRIPHHRALRGSIRGITPRDCAAALRWRDLLRPSLFIHVTLQVRADGRRTPEVGERERAEFRAAGFGPAIIQAQLGKLRKLVDGLEWGPTSSTWSDYSDRSHYEDDSLRMKASFVEAAAGERHRRQVLDLGANDGYFSRLVLPHADRVVAVDHDPLVIDRLYAELRREAESRILPLVIDLADPPGGMGWRARERAPFTERVRPDLVLCLALVHHLAITESVPLEEIVAFLGSFDSEVVLEFPERDDQMVQLLMAQKKGHEVTADRYGRDRLEAELAGRFETAQRLVIGSRVLYHLRPLG